MKNIMLLLLFGLIGGNAFAQKIITTGSSSFTIPIIENPYGPNDQINFDYFATNNTDNDLFINPTFQLLDGSEVVYEWMPNSEILSSQFTEGSIIFPFPDDCSLPNGTYQLRFVVNYSQPPNATSPVVYTTRDGNLSIICNNQNIPTEAPYTSEDCEVFVLDIVFENEGPCCSLDPDINLASFPIYPHHAGSLKHCQFLIKATIDWGDDPTPTTYNAVWNSGASGLSFVHYCGEGEYFITISWQENGEWCSKVSETIRVRSSCACRHTISVGTNEKESFLLSPTLNDGHFHVLLPKGQKATTFEIWNIAGTKLLTRKGIFENSVPITLGEVEAGMYLLRARYEDGTQETKQFIVE